MNLKASFAAGIGLFITFIGLVDANIVVLGSPGAPVHVGDLTDKAVLLAIFGTLLISFFLIRRVKGSLCSASSSRRSSASSSASARCRRR
jgi:AGZA family xanthine/uracil permease-like MFS transporter